MIFFIRVSGLYFFCFQNLSYSVIIGFTLKEMEQSISHIKKFSGGINMTTVIPALLFIFIIFFGFIFIFFTVKVDKLDEDARNKSSEIDGNLWDRAFQLTKLVDVLNEKGIEHDIEAPNINAYGLGMSTLLQSTSSEELDNKERQLRKVMKKHPELESDETFNVHWDKFQNARSELMKSSLAYNKSVNAYSNGISTFPSNAIASFHKKKGKMTFAYIFTDLNYEKKDSE